MTWLKETTSVSETVCLTFDEVIVNKHFKFKYDYWSSLIIGSDVTDSYCGVDEFGPKVVKSQHKVMRVCVGTETDLMLSRVFGPVTAGDS